MKNVHKKQFQQSGGNILSQEINENFNKRKLNPTDPRVFTQSIQATAILKIK